jgi:hypothetical protein
MPRKRSEWAERCPAPPYTRWDQRGRPVLQATLKLPDGTTVRAMLNTDDRKIAVQRMRLIVVLLVLDGRLPANSPAARLYGRRPALGVAEVKRLAAMSREEYAVERKTAAARLGLSPPTLDDLTKQQPPELPNRDRQRRHRARQRGQRIAMANFWYHRPPRGKGFYKNGRVMTARIHLARSATTWSLKFRDDDERAAAIMKPVRVAWDDVYEAAKQELGWEIGTAEHTAAVAARVGACARLASAIITAGGPKKLAEFVLKGPHEEVGTAVPQRAVALTAAPSAALSATRRRQAAEKECKQLLIERYQAYLRDGCKERPLKDELRVEMTGLIPKLSGRAFDRSWKGTAVAKDWDWKDPGFRGQEKTPSKNPLKKPPQK